MYKAYFKLILTFNTGTRAHTKKNKSTIQVINIKFLESVEGKTGKDSIRNEIFR
jgi:hypothetical protein